VSPTTVDMADPSGRDRPVSAEKIIVATGTRPARPASVEFDERTIIDSDGILLLERVPRSMIVAGAGVIGIEYASMFAALGTKVTVVEQRERMLEFCDIEVVEALKYHLRDLAVTFRFGETVAAVERHPDGAMALLASGKRIPAETVMYSAGRQGMTDGLGLEAAGLAADDRGRIKVGEFFQTSVPSIYAVGDVIGFPALAATSMEQGRVAALHACGEPLHEVSSLQPIGIYSLPEISFIGRTEDQLTRDCVPFEVGVSRYRELARGQIVGDSYGVLKLLVSPADRTLLGVHVFGTGATELVHIGQAVIASLADLLADRPAPSWLVRVGTCFGRHFPARSLRRCRDRRCLVLYGPGRRLLALLPGPVAKETHGLMVDLRPDIAGQAAAGAPGGKMSGSVSSPTSPVGHGTRGVNPGASSYSGIRLCHSASTSRISILARCEPRQRCGPPPNA
jgi:pyruvate/2-oxoglutarate dehydrogenase complex dihydrolipoamide dehydrogenase (E3) component